MATIDALRVPCTYCKAVVGKPCVFITGPNTGKPRKALGPHSERIALATTWTPILNAEYAKGAASRNTEVTLANQAAVAANQQVTATKAALASTTAALDTANQQLATTTSQLTSTIQELTVANQTVQSTARTLIDVTAQRDVAVKALADYKATHPDTPPPPPPIVVEPKHPVPADALFFHPSGSNSNSGTEASPRKTPLVGRTNVALPGKYNNFSTFLTGGGDTTIMAADGDTAIFDGGDTTHAAFTLAVKTNFYGDLQIQHYAPTSPNNGSNSPVYFGGSSAGSEVDGMTVSNSAYAGLSFQVPVVLTNLTVTDTGHTGIMGTTADGCVFGDVKVLRVNRRNFSPDGQLGGIKVTRSKDLLFSSGVYVEDCNGANGVWTDVSCRNPVFNGVTVVTGANGKPAAVGLLLEETQGGVVYGCESEAINSMRLTATGGVRVWNNNITGSSTGLTVWQDRLRNSGTNPANLDPALAPWWAVNNEICNNTLVALGGYNIAFTAYADHAALGMLAGKDMISALKGNIFTGSVQMGRSDGTTKRDAMTDSQLAAYLGSKYDSATQPVPADLI